MSVKTRSLLTATSLIALIPTMSMADVTALDVWTSWKQYMGRFGYEITAANDSYDGATLTIDGIKADIAVPEGKASASFGQVEFMERGDGTVAVKFGDTFPMSMVMDMPDQDGSIDMTMIMKMTGANIIVSGDPKDMTYTYSIANMTFDFDKFIVDGDAVQPDIAMKANGMAGVTRMTDGTDYELDSNGTVSQMEMTFKVDEDGEQVNMGMNFSDITIESNAVIPEGFSYADPASMFGSNFVTKGKMSSGPGTMKMEVTGSDSFSFLQASNGIDFWYDMGAGAFNYGGRSNGDKITVSLPDMGLPPIEIAAKGSEFDFGMPMAMTEDFKDAKFVLRLMGFTINDFYWQLLDPQAVLPRDPATIEIDLSGKARAVTNLFDEEAMEEMDEMPFEIESATINKVLVEAAGARAEGTGAFTFDNSDLETFDGMPAPDGKVNFNFYGINGLIDNLIKMGMIPEDQAMGFRMMLGMFARPGGSGTDHLTSEIVVGKDGSISANGQRLQ